MSKITPFLWFDGKAEEAMNFYVSLFKNSKIIRAEKFVEGSPFPKDWIMMGVFELDGQRYYCMDAGPQFPFTEAISMFVSCEDQAEVDYFWNAFLAHGGTESQCGWLKDKYGMSWQIIPKVMSEILGSPEKEKKSRAFQAMMTMKKLDVAALQKAFNGE